MPIALWRRSGAPSQSAIASVVLIWLGLGQSSVVGVVQLATEPIKEKFVTKKEQTNQITYIEFPAKTPSHLAEATQFYSAAFGWSFKNRGDDYADTKDAGLGIGVNARSEHQPKAPLAVIYAQDLEATRERIIAAKGRITHETFTFPGGRRFHFVDPAGNEVAVWSDQ